MCCVFVVSCGLILFVGLCFLLIDAFCCVLLFRVVLELFVVCCSAFVLVRL